MSEQTWNIGSPILWTLDKVRAGSEQLASLPEPELVALLDDLENSESIIERVSEIEEYYRSIHKLGEFA